MEGLVKTGRINEAVYALARTIDEGGLGVGARLDPTRFFHGGPTQPRPTRR